MPLIARPPGAAAPAHCDVLVIGGGPAGSTISALLARQGRDVLLIEKARHPRFHIGESLLPANVALFERLGVRAQVEAIGMPKWGVEFVSPQHTASSCIEFSQAWDKSMPRAWQVRRSALDEILFRHAGTCGARTFEACRARQVAFDDEGATVEAALDDGTPRRWRARFVVDASGRDTLLAGQFGIKARNPRHNSAAIFGHFTGARRLEGRREGNISIFWFEHCWFWFIPLADGATSVGAVIWPAHLKTRKQPVRDFFLDLIAQCPALAERLKDAELVSDVEATGNFSYSCDRSHGTNYLLLGDAYAFIDPVFSSGVLLAMNSAFVGAEAVDTCLRQPDKAAMALRHFDQAMKHGPKEFSWFIYRVTNPTMRNLFMSPRNYFRVREALLSVLAGDIFGKTPIWRSLLAFKAIYYLTSLANLKRTIMAWKRRKLNIRTPDEAAEVGCR